jgi:hypothetical protein
MDARSTWRSLCAEMSSGRFMAAREMATALAQWQEDGGERPPFVPTAQELRRAATFLLSVAVWVRAGEIEAAAGDKGPVPPQTGG